MSSQQGLWYAVHPLPVPCNPTVRRHGITQCGHGTERVLGQRLDNQNVLDTVMSPNLLLQMQGSSAEQRLASRIELEALVALVNAEFERRMQAANATVTSMSAGIPGPARLDVAQSSISAPASAALPSAARATRA
jgi:hypothetical protein